MFSHTSDRGKILLIVYVNDIIITGDDKHGIDDFKRYLQNSFQTVWVNFVISWILR